MDELTELLRPLSTTAVQATFLILLKAQELPLLPDWCSTYAALLPEGFQEHPLMLSRAEKRILPFFIRGKSQRLLSCCYFRPVGKLDQGNACVLIRIFLHPQRRLMKS
jgi:hypothetical protein